MSRTVHRRVAAPPRLRRGYSEGPPSDATRRSGAEREAAAHRGEGDADFDEKEPVRRWLMRETIESERRWVASHRADERELGVPTGKYASTLPGRAEAVPVAKPKAANALPVAPGGVAGAPAKVSPPAPPSDRAAALAGLRDLDVAPVSGPVEPVTAFAWDGGDASTVKVYVTLAVDVLDPADVAVRFEAQRVRVAVSVTGRTLVFERRLHAPVRPSKCTFKVLAAKRVVALGLRKKAKDVVWPKLEADVNAADTLAASSKKSAAAAAAAAAAQ